MGRLFGWLAGITAAVGLLVGIANNVTKIIDGSRSIVSWFNKRDSIPDVKSTAAPEKATSLSREISKARQRAVEAAADARTKAARYPSEDVDRVLKQVAGLKFGISHLQLSNGARYDGQSQSGRMTGLGRMVWDAQNRKEGEFRNGKLHGFGCELIGDPRIPTNKWCGRWDDGKLVGARQLELLEPTGKAGERRIWDDPFELAVIEWSSTAENTVAGMRYEGELKDTIRNGYGIGYFVDGSRYEGQWLNRWQQGLGAKMDASGNVEKAGVWESGELKISE
jgi:hypothetical protein